MPTDLSFLTPTALWALSGLVVPVILHLLGRGQRRRVLVASVRDLVPRPALSGLRWSPSDIPLLLLRLALLALLALALAQPSCSGRAETGTSGATPVVWTGGPDDDVWGAIRAADRDLPPGAPLRVEAPATSRTLRGSRPSVDREVVWSAPMGVPDRRDPTTSTYRSRLPTALLWWAVALAAIAERLLAARRRGDPGRPVGEENS